MYFSTAIYVFAVRQDRRSLFSFFSFRFLLFFSFSLSILWLLPLPIRRNIQELQETSNASRWEQRSNDKHWHAADPFLHFDFDFF